LRESRNDPNAKQSTDDDKDAASRSRTQPLEALIELRSFDLRR
jgi:hypothetical protein